MPARGSPSHSSHATPWITESLESRRPVDHRVTRVTPARDILVTTFPPSGMWLCPSVMRRFAREQNCYHHCFCLLTGYWVIIDKDRGRRTALHCEKSDQQQHHRAQELCQSGSRGSPGLPVPTPVVRVSVEVKRHWKEEIHSGRYGLCGGKATLEGGDSLRSLGSLWR